MTEPLPLPPVKLRCTWYGLGALGVGHFLRAERRPRYAYEVVAVAKTERQPEAHEGGRTYRLTCARWRAAEVPEGAAVLRWSWEKR